MGALVLADKPWARDPEHARNWGKIRVASSGFVVGRGGLVHLLYSLMFLVSCMSSPVITSEIAIASK